MEPSTTKERPRVTEEGQAAAGRIAQARELRNSGVSAAGARSAVRAGQAPQTLTSQNLAPRTEAVLAEPIAPTVAPALQGELEAQTDQFTANLEKRAQSLEAGATSGLQSYIDQLTQARGVTGLTDEAYRQQGGVDDIAVELNDINDQIRREQLALRRSTESVAGQGQSKARTQAQIQNLTRESLRTQADLSVIQQGVQGRYDSAKAIADRAVAAQLEQQTNDLEIAKFNYTENKEMFTKAEQRAFESKVADRERALNTQEANMKEIYSLGIQAQQDGAPIDVVKQMLAAKTKEEAAAIGGSYIGALDREAQRASIANSYSAINDRNQRFQLDLLKFEQASVERVEAEKAAAATKEEAEKIENTAKGDKALSMLAGINELATHPGFAGSVGPNPLARVNYSLLFGPLQELVTGDKSSFKSEVDRLANTLTLENMDLLKGPATDKDVEIVAASMSRLKNMDVTETSYAQELARLQAAAQRIVDNVGVTPEQLRYYNLADEESINEAEMIWGVPVSGTGTEGVINFDY